MRTGRILLVEAEEELRHELDRELCGAGHDVASVADQIAAARLLAEGLQPDVVVAESNPPEVGLFLRELAPDAIHLRIDRSLEKSDEFDSPTGDPASCSADPSDLLGRIEEVLVHFTPAADEDDTRRCIELGRRLCNALSQATIPKTRIDLVTEGFDAFFGVRGTLVVKYDGDSGDWIEASQGLSGEVAVRISAEIHRRGSHRSVRPFLTRILVGEQAHEIACLPVQIGEGETNLALDLDRAPAEPELREALMNLVGSAMRGASKADRLRQTLLDLDAQRSSFDGLLQMVCEFTKETSLSALCEKVLASLRRELRMNRAAIFLPRQGGKGLLELHAVSGLSSDRLERIGLSSFHGLGQACLGSRDAKELETLGEQGTAARERNMLVGSGLRWGIAISTDEDELGLLFFGNHDETGDLPGWQRQTLRALVGSAAVALLNFRRIQHFEHQWAGSVRGLVAATELRFPEDRGHAERVALGAVTLGRVAGLASEELQNLALSALLHDVGKIGVAPGGGDDSIRTHPVLGSQILSRAQVATSVIQGVEQHHECYDGHGFPYGLRREEIHPFARIIAVANAYDRSRFRLEGPLPTEDALQRLARGAGLEFDPGLVAQFSAQVRQTSSSVFDLTEELWVTELVGAR